MTINRFKEPSGNTRGRLMHVTSTKVISDGYDSYREETFTPEENLGDTSDPSSLVTSRDAKGLHRPALDIDLPIAWVKRSNGDDHIWIDARCSKRAYRNLLQVLREFRIIDTSYVKPLSAEEAAKCYSLDSEVVVDTKAITAYMKSHAASYDGSFDQLLREAAENAVSTTHQVPGPKMAHPILLPLHVDAVVVDSASNHHLYLDTILSWDGYERVLGALKRAKIIEKKYYLMSIYREATCLRPPWAPKARMQKSVEEFLASR